MIVLFHIIVALLSIGFTTYLFVAPSQKKFYINYALIGLTFVSGAYLVARNTAHLAQSCFSGILYIGFMSTAMIVAHYRLERLEAVKSRTERK